MATNIRQTGDGNINIDNSRSKKSNTKITISIGSVVIIIGVILIVIFMGGNSSFAIEGKWKNTGTDGYGMAQPGTIIAFDGEHCNFYSPSDTYAFYKDESGYHFDLTSFLIGESKSFSVTVVNNDHIKIHSGSTTIELTRVG